MPAEQLTQAEEPTVLEYFPDRHVSQLGCPEKAWLLPTSQLWQVPSAEAEYVPEGQLKQSTDATVDVVPAEQTEQPDDPTIEA